MTSIIIDILNGFGSSVLVRFFEKYVSQINESHEKELQLAYDELDTIKNQRDKMYQSELLEKENTINELNSQTFNAERKVDYIKKTYNRFKKGNVILLSILVSIIVLIMILSIIKFKGSAIKDIVNQIKNKASYMYSDKTSTYSLTVI